MKQTPPEAGIRGRTPAHRRTHPRTVVGTQGRVGPRAARLSSILVPVPDNRIPNRRYRPFLRLLIGFIAVLAIGTAGYVLIEDNWTVLESLYMTVITITTIGFGEVRELSDAGRMFTILVIVMGLGLAAALIARLGQFVVESGIKDLYGRRKMTERIKKLRHHYILCGYGRTGSSIARKLQESNIGFVVIDSLDDHIDAARAAGHCVILGDASSDPVLLEAGVKRAAGTVLCVGDDATNVNIALAARELNGEQNIISRGTDPALEYRLIRAGADSVVYPMRLGGEQIARAIVDEYRGEGPEDEGAASTKLGYELRVVRNGEESRTLRSFLEDFEALRPVAIRRIDGSMVHNPKPDEIVGENESVLLLIHEERRNRVQQDVRILGWSDELATGSPRIDRELRKLYRSAEEFQSAVLEESGKDAVARRYELFTAYLGSHFHRQEILMRENGYPRQEEHQLSHEELSRRVQELNSDDRLEFPEEIWDALDRWLAQHVMEYDSDLSDYLREH